MTVFILIFNQMKFHLLQNQKENSHHDHIPFSVYMSSLMGSYMNINQTYSRPRGTVVLLSAQIRTPPPPETPPSNITELLRGLRGLIFKYESDAQPSERGTVVSLCPI